MSHRSLALLLVATTLATLLWRHELFTVQDPGASPRDLAALDGAHRAAVAVDVALPAVPIGMRRLRSGDGAVLVHYWAPWQQGAYAQAAALDSLRRTRGLERLRIEVVCFDPYPSVMRYLARRRLALPLLLDTAGELRGRLPCPSIPYTYVLDPRGRIAIRQAGRVEWLSAGTRRTLEALEREAGTARPAAAPA